MPANTNTNPYPDYVSVQERIVRFWSEYPDGAIRTFLVSDPADWSRCRYRADVFKSRESLSPDAVGFAVGLQGVGMTGKTTWEETAETSAIGRALANLGYATKDTDRPSREEMEKVSGPQDYQPAQARQTPRATPTPTRPAPAPHSAPQAAQRPANVTTLPQPGIETKDTFMAWMAKSNIAPKTVYDALGTESTADWLKDHPGKGWAGLKKVVEDAVFPAPAEASS